MTKAEREELQKQKLVEMQVYENRLRNRGIKYIGGVDEVGRGPLAGPVVAACVVLPEDFSVLGVDDSKKVSEKKRNSLYNLILENAVAWGIGTVGPEIIDEVNILQATKKAMAVAIESAGEKCGLQHLLIDAVSLENVDIPQTSIIKGDSKSVSIAAASIIAKVYRDNIMINYSKEYPGYAFEKNKGYGTKAHYEGISERGITPIHRKSFLKNIL
ncbi:MAG: ribonuclease HII [Hornefia sp.]|nr:ribonuclease HII [Hornefia sp.]